MQVLSAVLLWNYAFTKQLDRLPQKVKRDFVPTLINGEAPCHATKYSVPQHARHQPCSSTQDQENCVPAKHTERAVERWAMCSIAPPDMLVVQHLSQVTVCNHTGPDYYS